MAARLRDTAILLVALGLSALSAGCDFRIGLADPPPPFVLEGTWTGSLEEAGPARAMREASLTIDGEGAITAYLLDGVNQALTGTVSEVPGETTLLSYELSDGRVGTMVSDDAFAHLALLDDHFNVGVLELGAAGPAAAYANADVGPLVWQGVYFEVDAALAVLRNEIAALNVVQSLTTGDLGFEGFDGDGFQYAGTTPLAVDDPALGRYGADFVATVSPSPASGPLVILLSPDKTHAGAYACSPDRSAFPAGCRFYLWNRPAAP